MAEKSQNEDLRKELKNTIAHIRRTRTLKSRVLKEGQRLRRNAFNALEEKGLTDPDALISEYEKIQKKQSNLSSSLRELVNEIVVHSIRKIVARRMKEQKKANKEGGEK